MSCAFSEANCHVKTVLNENNLALILEFNQLFSKGIQLLRDVKENKRDLEEHELAALKILDDFFKEKEKNCSPYTFLINRDQANLIHKECLEVQWSP
uniref:Uncharacterized protein n=1 Tax=Magallana gigas TaxID=29159 RepID=A0A8W8KY30_MAGGI